MSEKFPDRCPICKISWSRFPPVNFNDDVLQADGSFKFMPTSGYRCVECKSGFRIIKPDPSAEAAEKLAEALETARAYIRGNLLEGAIVFDAGGGEIPLGKYLDAALTTYHQSINGSEGEGGNV